MSIRSSRRLHLPSLVAICTLLLPAAAQAEPESPADDQRFERAEHLELARTHATTLAELDAGRAGEPDPRARAELGFMASEVARELARQLRLAGTLYDGDGREATVLPPGPAELALIGAANRREAWLELCEQGGELQGSALGYREYLERLPDGPSVAEAFWHAQVEPPCRPAGSELASLQTQLARYELFLTHFPYHALAPRARNGRNRLLGELAQALGEATPDPVGAFIERTRANEEAAGPVGLQAPPVLWRIGADLDGDGERDLALALAPETGAPARWLVALQEQGTYTFVGSFALQGSELRLAVPTPGVGWLRMRGACNARGCEPLTYQISERGVRPVLDLGLPQTVDRAALDRTAESQLALPASVLRAEACALGPQGAGAGCDWKSAALGPHAPQTPAAPGP